MFVRHRGVVYSGNCQVLTDVHMECVAPSVPVPDHQIYPEEPLLLDYGFLLNGVVHPGISNSSNFSKFLLYPDPTCYAFNGEVLRHNKGNYLIINGTNFDLAFQVNYDKIITRTAQKLILFPWAVTGERCQSEDRDDSMQCDFFVAQSADVSSDYKSTTNDRIATLRSGSTIWRKSALHHRQTELRVAT